MKARALLLCLLTATLCTAGEEEFRKKIEKAKEASDDKAHAETIAEWRKAEPKSPEPLIADANRLFNESRSGIQLDTGKPEKGDLELKDPATGEVKGRLKFGSDPNSKLIGEALAVLREALTLAPHRLDIRGGMAFICQESGRFDEELKILKEMTKHALAHPKEQRWKDNAELDKPVEKFVPDKLHSYALYYYKKETPKDDKRFGAIAQFAADSYPEDPVAWNDLALFRYLSQKDTKGASECLEKAAKLAPEDHVVQFNLAQFYIELKTPAKAKAIYGHIIKTSKDDDDIASAKEKLEKLTKNDPDSL